MQKGLNPRLLYKRLCEKVGSYNSVLIAYSGGVDSTLVAKAAKDAKVDFLAVFCDSPLMPKYVKKQAKDVANVMGFPFYTVYKNELEDAEFCSNPRERCYICKRGLFEILKNMALERGFCKIAVGTNADDTKDYRPGMRAEEEYGLVRPLLDCGMGKKEITLVARSLGLPNAEAPSESCLASRIPFGYAITKDKIERIETAEEFLNSLGFKGCRVRVYEELVRIELRRSCEFQKMSEALRRKVYQRFKELGFETVTLDICNYHSNW